MHALKDMQTTLNEVLFSVQSCISLNKRCDLIHVKTRSSATAKSTASPSCLVGVLYDIYRDTNNRSTANQPRVRNWP